MSATARASSPRASATRPTPRRAPASTTRRPASRPAPRTRPTLREVPVPAPAVAGNGLFALVVVGLLVTGMGVLLVLNTTLAQGAFEIGSLESAQHALAVQEQQLQQTVALQESPEALQARAARLGMVPAASPVFLRLADGAVLGDPKAATGVRRTASSVAAVVRVPAHVTPSTDAAVADTPSDGAVADSTATNAAGTGR